MSVTDKLVGVEERYKAIEAQLGDPSLISDQKAYAAAMREYKNLTPIIEKYKEYLSVENQMQQAKELLDSQFYTVSEICLLSGYNNESYFSREFKKHLGISPSEYAKASRQ